MIALRAKAAPYAGVNPPKIILAGNPNAGKTTLFNYLTKSRLKTGNWHGVTTAAAHKQAEGCIFVDVPGMYSFNAFSMEEREAAREIAGADVIVNVVDALTLESSLALTRDLLALNKKTVVYVTKTNCLKRRGGFVNASYLSAYLGVPVFCGDKKALKTYLKNFSANPAANPAANPIATLGANPATTSATPLATTASPLGANPAAQPAERRNISFDRAYSAGNTLLNRAEKLFYDQYFALAFFILAITVMFFFAFHPAMPGAILKGATETLICDLFGGFMAEHLTNPLLSSLVCEGIIGGAGGVLSFIPQLAILYLFLTVLDESGVMSALAFVTDGLFEKVNLSGRAAFSLVSGFGCTAAAILTTRGFSEKDTQKRTVAVLAFVPCGAKLPVFLTFLSPMFSNPFPAVCALYFIGLAASVVGAKLLKGKSENLLSEVTPVGFPSLAQTQIKLFFYLKGFIIKVVTAVMLFCVASWFLSNFSFSLRPVQTEDSMLALISKAICPVFYPMGVRDWRLAYAIVSGFAAKENVAATVALLMPQGTGLAPAGSLAVSVFMLLCPACISAFAASAKEVGMAYTLKYFGVQLFVAFLGGYLTHLLFALIL